MTDFNDTNRPFPRSLTMKLYRRVMQVVSDPAGFWITDILWDVHELVTNVTKTDTVFWLVRDEGTSLYVNDQGVGNFDMLCAARWKAVFLLIRGEYDFEVLELHTVLP